MRVLKGRSISGGVVEGDVLMTRQPLSFFGGVDPDTGYVVDKNHELYNVSISDKILVMPSPKGSTASTWTLIQLAKNKLAPKAIITEKADAILIAGAIIGQIPTIDQLPINPANKFNNSQKLRFNGNNGEVEIVDGA